MLDLGVTGPMLRAAGVAWDVRKFEPYSSYEKFDFDVPTRTESDVYARYLVRIEEMRAEREDRPAGAGEDAATARAGRCAGIVLPEREKMKTADGGAHLSLQDRHRRLPRRPRARSTSAIESPRGEMGYYVVSDGTPKPYRVHMRTPCFGNLQALPKLVRRRPDRRRDRLHRQHGFRPGRSGPMMQLPPQLEAEISDAAGDAIRRATAVGAGSDAAVRAGRSSASSARSWSRKSRSGWA